VNPPALSILNWLSDPKLLGRAFSGESWNAWRAILAAAFGLQLTREQLKVVQACTRRVNAPRQQVSELWVAAGRRAGKSRIAAALAVFTAASRDYTALCAPGEVATVMILAGDRKQARVIFRYVRALLDGAPMLRDLVVNETAESVTLSSGAVIEIHVASYRSTRGYTCAAVICDEASFWVDVEDGANPASAVITALRPALATIPGAMLIVISSPYAQQGVLYETFRRYEGVDDPHVLTVRAASRDLNPLIPERVITEALAADESAARSEWLAEFRGDLETYISPDALRACVVPRREDLPPASGRRHIVAFTDPAGGGAGKFADSWATAIVEQRGMVGVVTALLEIPPPFVPMVACAEIAALLTRYGVRQVVSDKWGGDWPAALFREHRITLTWSEKSKSEIFLECLPILNGGPARVELPDNARLIQQFANLTRRRGKSGRDAIEDDGRRGSHDDLANCVAGALVHAAAFARPVVALSRGRTQDIAAMVRAW
jgi:hypothetical protein